MEFGDKITAVGRMQAHIATHLDEDISMDGFGRARGEYTYNAGDEFKRIFKKIGAVIYYLWVFVTVIVRQ